jgi:hypothetical protein
MKNYILLFFSTFIIFSCQETGKKDPEAAARAADSTAIAATIHGFYQWYDHNIKDRSKDVDFTKVSGKHLVLDFPLLEKYLSNIKSSGFVSDDFLENDRTYYRACEKIWKTEEYEDAPQTGMDADKYFCAQDYELDYWVKSPVRVTIGDTDVATATLYGQYVGDLKEMNFELKKENGKWLLTNIECDMGIDITSYTTAEQLAAFYTGTLPCADCDGIVTMLTLNADEQQSFTLEEEYQGKKSKTVESNGTWAIDGDIVTLTGKSSATKYQLIDKGLVSLNKDGSKRDEKSAEKFLLTKVLGE